MKIVENRKYFFAAPIIILLICLTIIVINTVSGRGAFNLDVEFSGGTFFQIEIGQEFSNDDIAGIVREATGQDAPQVQRVGDDYEVMIRLREINQETRTQLIQMISEKYNITDDAFTYSNISATISANMQSSAILAVVCACAAMLIYISIRFRNIRMGTAAIMALLHDALIVIAFYGVLRIPLNYSFVAVILTILGYSINATIVIFDRIRENRGIIRKASITDLVNISTTQTLRRSIFTSLTTLFVVLALYILGVASIREFTMPIIIGIIAGTYSSVFLVGTIWYMLSRKQEIMVLSQATQKAPAPQRLADPVRKISKAAGAEDNNIKQLSSTRRKKRRK